MASKIKQLPIDLGTTIEMRPPITTRCATPEELMAILKEISNELDRIGDDQTASAGYNLACKDNARIVREWLQTH